MVCRRVKVGPPVPCADSATFCQSNQFSHGSHPHLLDHPGTMGFDRLLDSAKVGGNLFVQFTTNDIFEHFPLTRCKCGQARADFGEFGLLLPTGAVFLNRHTNGRKLFP